MEEDGWKEGRKDDWEVRAHSGSRKNDFCLCLVPVK